MILITCTGDDADLDLEIYCDDDKMDFVLKDSDSPINLTDNVEIIGEVKYNDRG